MLVGYPAEYFHSMEKPLLEAGIEVFWVAPLRADARFLGDAGVAAQRVLDLEEAFERSAEGWRESARTLTRFENETDPRFNDIIQMDRLLRRHDWRFAVNYLAHVASEIERFMKENRIQLVSTWRDTAVQLTAMLVSRAVGVPFVVPTRVRIPQEVYGFCTAHHTQSFLSLREAAEEDLQWANDVLEGFETRAVKPALKKSSRNFLDVLLLSPVHLRVFAYELRRSIADRGNTYSRYSISSLVRMYVTRRLNLLVYQLAKPATRKVPDVDQYCLYALHTQPESSVDVQSSFFSNQLELIRYISRSLPASCQLFVKVHPTDVDGRSIRFYREISAIPGVVLLDYSIDSRTLLNGAAVVFALTGTIAYEAALARRPVIVFARNFFNDLPTVRYCTSPSELSRLVAALMAARFDPEALRADVLRFLATLRASCFDGEVSRTYGASNERLRASDLAAIKRAYLAVFGAIESGTPG